MGSPSENGRDLPRNPGYRLSLAAPVIVALLWLALRSVLPITPFTTLSGMLLLLVLAVTSYTDFRWGRIFNTSSYTAILTAIVVSAIATFAFPAIEDSAGASILTPADEAWVASIGAVSFSESLLGALAGFAIMLVIYRIAGGGAGDVKLGTAIGAFLGPPRAIEAILWTYIVTGLCVVIWLIFTIGPWPLLRSLAQRVAFKFMPGFFMEPTSEETKFLGRKVHLGPFFAMGTLAVLSGLSAWAVRMTGGYRP